MCLRWCRDFPHAASREAQIERIEAQIAQLRLIAQRCARDAASFIHPQLADIKLIIAGTAS
jgi:hypothetical protein